MIILYESTETTFTTLGIKVLKPLLATVRKEDNGDYVLTMTDTSANTLLYQKDRIIAVDTPWGRQGFRIGTGTKVTGDKVTLKAWHLFYDAQNYLIVDSRVVSQNANYALDHFNSNTDITSPFTTISDVTDSWSMNTIRKSLYEAVNDVLERWGGHLSLDNWTIGLYDTVGQDRGVSIAYGKNITDYAFGDDWSLVATKLLPVGKDGLTLDPVYVENAVDDYPIPYSKVVSFDQQDIVEDDYRDDDTGEVDTVAYQDALKADLLAQASKYLTDNHYPRVNYAFNAFIEGISDIGDTIRVTHPMLAVPLLTNVLAIEYNAVAERIDKVEFGNFNPKLSNLVKETQATIAKTADRVQKETTSEFNNRLLDATNQIASVMSDSYVIYEGDQILIVDALPKETATNVIRFNSQGIGFSSTGINGTFNSAWTIDGVLDMATVNAINLVADRIKGGTLRIGFYDGNSGLIEVYDNSGVLVGQIDADGWSLNNPNGDHLEITSTGTIKFYSVASGTEVEAFGIDRDVTNIAKLHARDQIEMPPIKIVPITSGSTPKGWAFVSLG
jgi:phage minor structural protein